METLPGPKTAIKNSKIKKMFENSKIWDFHIFPGRASYFPGEGSLFFWVGGLGAALFAAPPQGEPGVMEPSHHVSCLHHVST